MSFIWLQSMFRINRSFRQPESSNLSLLSLPRWLSTLLLAALLTATLVACGGDSGATEQPSNEEGTVDAPSASPTADRSAATPTVTPVVETSATPGEESPNIPDRVFERWNTLVQPQHWWQESAPYSCAAPQKATSPWIEAGMTDLGGGDPLSLIRYYGNGSYLRYGYMGFEGCTPSQKYPDTTILDPPADPTYYSLGDLTITVDIARVPPNASGWFEDDGERETMTMTEAVDLLNAHIAPYYERISGGLLSMSFQAGNDYIVEGDGSPTVAREQQLRVAGIRDCRGTASQNDECSHGAPGGLNRLLLTDVTEDTGGLAYNGSASFGLVSLRRADMELLVHEIGHAWMGWPHSYTELAWMPYGKTGEIHAPNPYRNYLDVMSALSALQTYGWSADLPPTLAVNRYSAGWIDPHEVGLHLTESGVYTLRPPGQGDAQFLVISSGRPGAFTTVEVLAERDSRWIEESPQVFDPASPQQKRPFRYEGVLVSRYDQSTGTGAKARFGPALYDTRNPEAARDVGWGNDDYSVIQNGESREIGGGVTVQVTRGVDGSYEVAVTGGRVAPFTPWCVPFWFSYGEYDTGCTLEGIDFAEYSE